MNVNEMSASQIIGQLNMMFDWKRRPYEGKFLQRAIELLKEQDTVLIEKGEKRMTPKQMSNILIIILALIAATTATGLIAGYAMQPWIVAYWLVLTMKNIVDYIGVKR